MTVLYVFIFVFFFNDTATTEIYTLSLHDALPISLGLRGESGSNEHWTYRELQRDRKSTRLNSSHSQISYAVFCLKKKKNNNDPINYKKKKNRRKKKKTT